MNPRDDINHNNTFSNVIDLKKFKSAIAGGLAGAFEVCITYPTELIKTELQLDQKMKSDQNIKKLGFLGIIKKTVKEKGFFGLYRGSTVLFVGSVPKTSVRFASYETFCAFAKNDSGEITLATRALGGLVAGFTEAILIVTPIETIKVKFINDLRQEPPRFNGFVHGIKLILKENGMKGIYQGIFPTILRQSTNQSIRFFIVEACKDAYNRKNATKTPPKLLIGCFGVLAGVVSVFSNTPIDVVKTRLQGLDAKRYKGTIDCFVQIWKSEGPKAFYKGTVARIARACLEVSVTFMAYDVINDLLN